PIAVGYSFSLHDALPISASVKAVPVAFVLYLVYKRAWRETGWTLAGLVLLNVALPVFVLGPHETATYWHRWREVSDVQIAGAGRDRKSTRLNSSHGSISY